MDNSVLISQSVNQFLVLDFVKFCVLALCATIVVGVSAYATTTNSSGAYVRIGIFNSQKSAQVFFEGLPSNVRQPIANDQLWLNAYNSPYGFTEHHLEISGMRDQDARNLCAAVHDMRVQCVVSVKTRWASVDTANDYVASSQVRVLPRKLHPLGIRLYKNQMPSTPEFNLALLGQSPSYFNYERSIEAHGAEFSLVPQVQDTPQSLSVKAAYDIARDKFVRALQNVDQAEDQKQAARDNIIALGKEVFEVAGQAYLSSFIQKRFGQNWPLDTEAGAGKVFMAHVEQNLTGAAENTLKNLMGDLLQTATSGEDFEDDYLRGKADEFMLAGARGIIDAGLSAARKSDLYALRNLELEYNLNNFEESYFSGLITQPVHQSKDLRHNFFAQVGGIVGEKSVDIKDDVSRHTVNIGAAYRHLTVDEKYLLGANVFYDHQFPYNHSRLSIGADAKSKELNFAANYYYPLSSFQNSRTDEDGNEYEERALEGYDFEVGYTPPFMPALSLFGKGYQYYRSTEEDLRGFELSAEYDIRDEFTLKGSMVEENGGRDGLEVALQYRIPLYDTDKPNIALAELQPAAGSDSVRDRIFEKVRRENRIRVEERLKAVPASAAILTAQFNALSVGLPYDVGGVFTGAGVNLPFDTTITVPNGDFGIIEFSNGAVANVSASGGGDVTLQFNATTLTVLATNGGFVQFVSASGGITNVVVPGGTVNLLGTDVDITDDGTTTTIQVRAGQIDVIPDVGVATLIGNQGDVVSLTIASGATSTLAGAALTTRQDDAFTNLDFANPNPPTTSTSAPFVNVLPELTTGPQFVGNDADLRLTFTQPVTVGGAPFINGLVDANARTFAYNAAASTPTRLVFRHTYVAGDVGAANITVQDLDLNGGTIIGTTNTLPALTAYTDTVLAISDLTAPSLASSTPVDNEPAASAGADIVLNFDENIQAGTGNIILTDTTDGSDNRVIPIGDAQISIVGSTLTFNPTVNLELVTDYDLTIGSGVIEDLAGNDFAGIATTELNFTTSAGTVPMFVSVTPPADGTYTNGQDLDWTLNYDQAVTVAGGPPTITLTLDSGPVVATFAGGSGTANLLFRYTITGADLDTDGVVLSNTITTAGATLLDTLSLTQNADTDFTAVNPATPAVLIDQPPTLASSTPVDNATGESVGVDVTLTFNENVQAGVGNIVFTDTDDGSGDFTIPVGDARVGIAGAVVTIDLSAQLLEFNTNYEITMAAGVFEDTGVLNLPFAGLASGDLNWQTVVDPTAGFPAATVTMAPGTTAGSHENAQDIGSWQTTIDLGATPDGIIFESGATGQGIAAAFDGVNLVFAAGDGATTVTNADGIFGSFPIASIGQGLHHFVFVADPDAAAEIGVYIDGIRVITETIPGGMQSGEWAGTNGSGYGVNNTVRAGVDTSNLTGATLTNNLTFYTNTAPASF